MPLLTLFFSLLAGITVFTQKDFTASDTLRLSQDVSGGMIYLKEVSGDPSKPIVIEGEGFHIDATGQLAGIVMENCSNIIVRNCSISANGGGIQTPLVPKMRCGVLFLASKPGKYTGITISDVSIDGIYYEDPGFLRSSKETVTENGTGNYGYGIRFFTQEDAAFIEDVTISGCKISRTSHTGIRMTVAGGRIKNVSVTDNIVYRTGGPGIQMSNADDVYCARNRVSHSGDGTDSRAWHRGSGMWVWNSNRVIIEHNSFSMASGPGDSAGVHIDFNSNDVIVQYNLSSNNEGGFCQILGNCHNCAYRYNVSINDGYRKKGEGWAFMDSPLIHISGYVGNGRPRTGPFDCYVYNNTIIVDDPRHASVAIDKAARGIMIANNLFMVNTEIKIPEGDLYLAGNVGREVAKDNRIIIEGNTFLGKESFPYMGLLGENNTFGKMNKPKDVRKIPGDEKGLYIGLDVDKDYFGRKITKPIVGASKEQIKSINTL